METLTKVESSKLYSLTSSFFDRAIGTGPVNWPILALARFVLAFIVISAHAINYTNQPGPLTVISYFNPFNAVIGFLLISGLSIGKSILSSRENFFVRRVKRIYPVYIASIFLFYFISPVPITVDFIIYVVLNMLFLNQLITARSYIYPAWTLALEVWLYSLAPFLSKLSYKTLLIITLLSFLSYCLYTCGRSLFHWPAFWGNTYGINIFFLSFLWVAGFMLSIFDSRKKLTSFVLTIIFIIYFLLSFLIQIVFRLKHHQISQIFGDDLGRFALEAIGLLFIYAVVVSNRRMPNLSPFNRKLFNFLGNISYPLYLTHASILVLCQKLHITNWALIIACTLLAASLTYWLFDFYNRKRINNGPALVRARQMQAR